MWSGLRPTKWLQWFFRIEMDIYAADKIPPDVTQMNHIWPTGSFTFTLMKALFLVFFFFFLGSPLPVPLLQYPLVDSLSIKPSQIFTDAHTKCEHGRASGVRACQKEMGSKGKVKKSYKISNKKPSWFIHFGNVRECTLSYHVRDTLSFFDHIFDRNI